MPSTSKITRLQFSAATIMIGPMSLGFGLNLIEHGVGAVKNLLLYEETSFAELTQGAMNQVIASMSNRISIEWSVEINELTERNRTCSSLLDTRNQLFGIKILGADAAKRPTGIYFPKCEISNRLGMNSITETGNLLLEFQPSVPLPTDSGYDPDFAQKFVAFTPS